MKPRWWILLAGGALNGVVVAAIGTLSLLAAEQRVSVKAIAIAFGLTFLVELRKWLPGPPS